MERAKSQELKTARKAAIFHVYTTAGDQIQKCPFCLPHIERIDSVVDRLAARQIESPIHYDLSEYATRLDRTYRY